MWWSIFYFFYLHQVSVDNILPGQQPVFYLFLVHGGHQVELAQILTEEAMHHRHILLCHRPQTLSLRRLKTRESEDVAVRRSLVVLSMFLFNLRAVTDLRQTVQLHCALHSHVPAQVGELHLDKLAWVQRAMPVPVHRHPICNRHVTEKQRRVRACVEGYSVRPTCMCPQV